MELLLVRILLNLEKKGSGFYTLHLCWGASNSWGGSISSAFCVTMDKEVIGTLEELRGDISEDIFDDSEEVSLLELDQEELAKAMEEAGISIKVPSTVGTHAKHISFPLLMRMLRTNFTRPYRCERCFGLSKRVRQLAFLLPFYYWVFNLSTIRTCFLLYFFSKYCMM